MSWSTCLVIRPAAASLSLVEAGFVRSLTSAMTVGRELVVSTGVKRHTRSKQVASPAARSAGAVRLLTDARTASFIVAHVSAVRWPSPVIFQGNLPGLLATTLPF